MRTGLLKLLTLAIPVLVTTSSRAAPLVAYDDALQNGFEDWSWATHQLQQTAVVHQGSAAASLEPDNWEAFYLHRTAGIDVTTYDSLELWVHGGSAGGQQLSVALLVGGEVAGSGELADYLAGGAVPANGWAQVVVPFAALGVTGGVLDGVWLQDATGGDQSIVYVDDVQFLERTTPLPDPETVTVAIDPDADRRPINPDIYGVNFGDVTQAEQLHWPVRRWGGNSTTRYSWEHDISNRAADWFFYNIENDHPNPAELPNNSSSDRFIDESHAAGSKVILTIPMIGWTPTDRTRRWGFSVQKYGAQQQTECTATGNASWCNDDAGNGITTAGNALTGNDPQDTSRAVGPDHVTAWMQHVASRVGTAANGGVRLYALDNEPFLWNSTHRDVHPTPVTYDELWQRTLQYATAIKNQDPDALTLGPADWGWCAYFGSAADNCVDGPDRQAHGGTPFLEWYLQQVCAHEASTGVRLVDYLDIHYYPQANGVSLSDDESAAVAATRLRSIKGLYDASYVDESWIGQAVRLIPRMKEWIDLSCPGTRLAITEYNWGGDDGASSALAQAEVLAVFGREGVDLATRWVSPEPGTRVEDAFRLYLDYDGAGAHVTGESVRAVSSNVDDVGAYAVREDAGQLYVLLFNKSLQPRTAQVSVAGGITGDAALYRFDASSRLSSAGSVATQAGGLSLVLPARSATLAVVSPGSSSGSSSSSGGASSGSASISSSSGGASASGGTSSSGGASASSAAASSGATASSSGGVASSSASGVASSSAGSTSSNGGASTSSTGGGTSSSGGVVASSTSEADGTAGPGPGCACVIPGRGPTSVAALLVVMGLMVRRRGRRG
ncbi:MAG: glycoside hydrolase family 44 protein [Myxococcota bacterium]